MYVVVRNVGKNKDYLMSLDNVWGTACIGDIKQAMSFFSYDEAVKQAERAQATCRGIGGVVDPDKIQFTVKPL